MNAYFKRIIQFLPREVGAKIFLILIITASIFIGSCNKSSIVGLEVQPTGDLLNVRFLDTATLITRTVREDSLRTDESLIVTGNALLGKYIDPIFGTSTSSVYSQLRLPVSISATSFGTSPVCDSIVMTLIYDSTYYGKKERKAQTLNIYQVLDDISGTKYSSDKLNMSTVDLTNGGFSFVPKPNGVKINGIISNPRIRVAMDQNFGQSLLKSQSTGNLSSNATFQTFMKGFYITTENTSGLTGNEGNIVNLRMAESKVTIYYHNSLSDSSTFDFSFGDISRFRHFTHDYSNCDVNLAKQLSSNHPVQNNTVYVQSMAGVKTKIEMPYLMNWLDSGAISINKAELVIKIDQSSTYQLDTFAAPSKLIVFGISDEGSSYFIPDYFEGSPYFDGTYNSDSKEYRINMARYIQQILAGKRTNNGLYLLASNAQLSAGRAVIGGGESGNPYQMKLNLTITKLH